MKTRREVAMKRLTEYKAKLIAQGVDLKELREKAAIAAINKMSVEKLLELWDNAANQRLTPEMARYRGWLVDALDAKVI